MITASYVAGDRLRLRIRGHELFTDQPVEEGGDDTAPTPTELFVSSLAACVAFYAERFLRRNDLPALGLTVTCDYGWAENPHRVGAIELKVAAPEMPASKRAAFQRVIERCTVHNSLDRPPIVLIRLAPSRTVAAYR